ncbi:putative acyl- dehydrogenase protein [Rutstroemia sp. NJR-2017a BBW]|nr:putative acyl- dehydrogenase protein [Rutstroemia sp. NJR-2017a BBW]
MAADMSSTGLRIDGQCRRMGSTRRPDLYQKFAAANFLIPNLPSPLPVEHLRSIGITHLPGDLPIADFDYLHTLIYTDELARSGSMGPSGAITTGMAFGVPPIIKFGSESLQKRFLPDLLTGKKRICIAITEPGAGSDVAAIETTAKRSRDGKFWIVDGEKKWITNGLWSDYATMAVRTNGPGPAGLSLLVVPLLGHEGVSMRRIRVGGQTSGGTTYISLSDVRVPIENLVGVEELQPRAAGSVDFGEPAGARGAERGGAVHDEAGGVWEDADGAAGGAASDCEVWGGAGEPLGLD